MRWRGWCGWRAWSLLWVLSMPAMAGTVGRTETIRRQDGTTVVVERGVLRVPESRLAPGPRTIGIPWYRLRATTEHPAAPIFMLAGGPGSSGLEAVQRPEGYREIAFYRSIADVVVFDQRGAGLSTPRLSCPQSALYPQDQPLDPARLRETRRHLLAECRDHWLRAGVDLSAYNTLESAADVDALRQALGYRRISLIGGSYGSHLGLQIMRMYPTNVERAVFHGIEGPDQTWDDPDAMLAAMRRIDEAAQARAPGLGLEIPDGGYLASLARTIARLQAKPELVEVSHDGARTQVVVDAEIVRLMVRRGGAGNHDRLDAWPRMVLALANGDLRRIGEAASSYRHLRLSDPMHWSMDCSSSASPARRARAAASPAVALLGRLNAEYEDLCDLWPARQMGADYWTAPSAPIPTLLFHGTWDVSTPLENAREVLAGLADGRLVTVEGGSHGVLYNLYGRWAPMRALMRDFLSGKPVDPPARVVMPWASERAGDRENE